MIQISSREHKNHSRSVLLEIFAASGQVACRWVRRASRSAAFSSLPGWIWIYLPEHRSTLESHLWHVVNYRGISDYISYVLTFWAAYLLVWFPHFHSYNHDGFWVLQCNSQWHRPKSHTRTSHFDTLYSWPSAKLYRLIPLRGALLVLFDSLSAVDYEQTLRMLYQVEQIRL
jgi:hypothetical protein